MRIEKIEIKNFRQYKNVTYSFPVKKGKRDLHIIIGRNGIGKTNLLNAITWCLYGTEPHLGNEKNAQPRINIDALESARNENKNNCSLQVRMTFISDVESIIFERTQVFKVENAYPLKDTVAVTELTAGKTNVITDEDGIERIINMYLPRAIREYFFFDGEQLDKYFISGNGGKIKEAIYDISQVNLLTSMSTRLSNVINDLQSEAAKKDPQIKELNDKKTKLQEVNTELKNYITECETQIANADATIISCSEFLTGKDGVPEKEKLYQKHLSELEEKKTLLEEAGNELKSFVVHYKTLFALYPCLKKTMEYIKEKDSEGALPPKIDSEYINKMLNNDICLVCGRELNSDARAHMLQLLTQLELSSEQSNLLSRLSAVIEGYINDLKNYPHEKESKLKIYKSLENDIKSLNDECNTLDEYLKNFTDTEKINKMHTMRKEQSEIKSSEEAKKFKYEENLNDNNEELENIENLLTSSIKQKDELELIEKQIEFAKESSDIINSIKNEMIEESQVKLRDETLKLFTELDWKKRTFARLEIDDNYNFEVYDEYNYPTIGSCSAAERALLALSFTLALQKVSGYNSMLFIDTPVGRVDLENRTNFGNVLSKVAENKQVIMTFTPSEYSEEIKNTIEPVSSTYTELKTDNEKETYL